MRRRWESPKPTHPWTHTPFISRAYLQHIGGSTDLPVGYHPDTKDEFLIPSVDRYAGTYILGLQGNGKSGLIENMVAQDVTAGNAVVVIDPHGDLTDNCIKALPAEAVERTYVLDMLDEEYPFGVNVFAGGLSSSSVENAKKISRVGGIFEVLWAQVLSQAYLPRYLRAAVIVLLAANATLVDMKEFLLDDDYRARLLANLKGHDDVKKFWEKEYTELSQAERMQRIASLVGKLESLFLGRPLMRNIMGQHRTTINFREEIAKRSIIFVKLPIKQLGEDAELIGTILISQLHSAIFSFSDMPEAQRPGVSLYVDEFQHFATPDFSELFSEGRKFGARVTLAHQWRSQVPAFLRDSTTSARTKICFQLSHNDAGEMSHYFPSQGSSVKHEDIDRHASQRLMEERHTFPPVIQDFIDVYLLPLKDYRRGDRVEITNGGFDWRSAAATLFNGPMLDLRMDDPLPFLDALLFEVMDTGNSDLLVRKEIPIGFSNSGQGFFAVSRDAHVAHRLAVGDYPAGLVTPTQQGPQWVRPPQSSREQYYHCIFRLRQLMDYLAANPIGKVTELSNADVAQMLTQLGLRAAFVRSGDDVGVIYTHNTPTKISGQELAERVAVIRDQTRITFCHPREDVEQVLAGLPAIPDEADPDLVPTTVVRRQPNRWETV